VVRAPDKVKNAAENAAMRVSGAAASRSVMLGSGVQSMV